MTQVHMGCLVFGIIIGILLARMNILGMGSKR